MNKTEFELNRIRSELFTYLRPLFRPLNIPDKKFVIFAQTRTGSNLLKDLLNSHPKLYCDGEILLEFTKSTFKKVAFPYLYLYSKSTTRKTKVYGCNLKIDQLWDSPTYNISGNPTKFMLKLHENDWKIIYIKRINILRQAISELIAMSRNIWLTTEENCCADFKVYIDCKQLIQQIRWHKNLLLEEKNVLEKLPHLTIIYENNLLRSERHQETLDGVFNYLEINSVSVKTKLVRNSSDRMSDFIQNYEEVVKFIEQTEYAKFLNDY